ncbi:MAG: cyclic nucleotide-binding domain-containing protein [Pseudomonadota bacterium]
MAHPKAEDILGQFSFLEAYGKTLDVPEGFMVIRDGDAAGSMFFILEGLVEVTKDERLLAVLEPGEVFGEMSLVDGRPRSANVAALQPTQLIRIDRDDFEEAGVQNLDLLRFMMEVMANRIRNTNALAAAFAPARQSEIVESFKKAEVADDPSTVFASADAALIGAKSGAAHSDGKSAERVGAHAAAKSDGDAKPSESAGKPASEKRHSATDASPRNTERRW